MAIEPKKLGIKLGFFRFRYAHVLVIVLPNVMLFYLCKKIIFSHCIDN